MSNTTSHYLTRKLLDALMSKKQKKVIIAGRGTGKSTYLGWEMYESFREMPKSLGALTGPAYSMILTKILPSAKKTLTSLGLKEHLPKSPGHFTIGRKPPSYFKAPYTQPEKFEYVISMYNGSSLEFISMDRPDLARGGSYDYMLNDEAVFGKQKMHEEVLELTLRGNRQYFAHCHRHGMQVFVSSQAHSKTGYWVEDMQWMRDEKGEFLLNEDGDKVSDLDVFFSKLTSYDNRAILGDAVLKRWEKLPPQKYRVEIMSERMEKPGNSFYPAWDHDRHTYTGGFEYDYDDATEFGVYVKRNDTDRDPKLPFLVTCDFNAAQNSWFVAQEQKGGKELRFLNEFYRPGNDSVEDWLKPFVEYYRGHQEKRILLYGDPGGNKKLLFDQMSVYANIESYLQQQGWRVENKVVGVGYPKHITKQKFIHQVLSEGDQRLPVVRMHFSRCRWLIASVEATGILPDFTKDKGSERQDVDQRGATHGSDAFDYLIFFRYSEALSAMSAFIDRVRV